VFNTFDKFHDEGAIVIFCSHHLNSLVLSSAPPHAVIKRSLCQSYSTIHESSDPNRFNQYKNLSTAGLHEHITNTEVSSKGLPEDIVNTEVSSTGLHEDIINREVSTAGLPHEARTLITL